MDRDFIIRADLCTEQLNDLVAEYLNYAHRNGIDLSKDSEFTRKYRDLVKCTQNSRYVNTNDDLLKYEAVIEKYKKQIE